MRVDWWVVALVIASGSAGAEPLGTLLHSAAERAQLDAPAAPARPIRRSAPADPPVITGYLTRSDGRATVFFGTQPPLHVAGRSLSSDCSNESAAIPAWQASRGAGDCKPPDSMKRAIDP